MFTLSIEHPITDFATWRAAFDLFAPARAQAGVTGHRIRHLVDDPRHLDIELDFPSLAEAQSFREFLTTVVWVNSDASPALAGTPSTRILAWCDDSRDGL
jgi:hypothetical protein